jgi:ABC-type uncharacterized transport system involved in gliding motility auxiliary subunit
MKTEWRRFASIGLYLAILAALASAGLFIVQRQFNLPLQIGLGLIVIGLAVFAILDPDRVRRTFTGRQARYGSNVLVMSIAFIGILGVINYLGNQYSKRWDLTADKTHTLAPETIKILQSLPQPVTVDAFFSARIPSDTAKNLLEDFKSNATKVSFSYKIINPDADPVAAQQAGITQDGSLVFHMGSHQEVVTSANEQDMTTALVRLINPGQRNVYFITGHGEEDPDASGSGSRAYSMAKAALTSKNYTVKKLNLLTEHQVPADATVVVVAGPTQPLAAEEIKPLQDYVDKGGALVVMEEPLPVTKFGTSPDPLADYLAQKWNIVLGKDIIVDQGTSNLSVAIGVTYGSSPITQKLANTYTIFPTARSVTVQGSANASSTAVVLVSTSQQSWAETDFAALTNNQVVFDAAKDKAGPISVAVADQNSTTNAHIVVVGDADFASDAVFAQYGNSDFFGGIIDWASGQQNLITLTPKQSTTRIIMAPQSYMINLIFLGTVIVIPGLVLFSGVFTWIQRRRRG